jgi:hypothetical protein
MPTDPGGIGFTVTHLGPERLLVLRIPQAAVRPACCAVVVILTLEPAGDGGTRLPCRLRADIGANLASRLYGLLCEIGDFVMMRLMLAGIKTRAGKLAAAHESAVGDRTPRAAA